MMMIGGSDELTAEEARRYLKARKVSFVVTLMSMWMVLGIMWFTVVPKLQELYVQFGAEQAVGSNVVNGLIVLATITGLAGLPIFSGKWDSDLEKIFRENGGLGKIKRSQVPGRGQEALALFLVGCGVAYIVSAIVAPIYRLTSDLG